MGGGIPMAIYSRLYEKADRATVKEIHKMQSPSDISFLVNTFKLMTVFGIIFFLVNVYVFRRNRAILGLEIIASFAVLFVLFRCVITPGSVNYQSFLRVISLGLWTNSEN